MQFSSFQQLINKGEEMIKDPDFFWRTSVDNSNVLHVMRRWNSHTPAINNVHGGGYYLKWNKRGTIIDPGVSFFRLFRYKTKYSFDEISNLIITHDHIDHVQDLAVLISLLRQFNKRSVKNNKPPKIWDMVVSYGVADEYVSMFNHPDNSPFLFWQRVLAEKELKVENVKNIPDFLVDAKNRQLLSSEKYLETYLERAGKTYEELYSYELNVLRANHKELLGASTAFGVKFVLKEDENDALTIVISGDTAISPDPKNTLANGEELARLYSGANLLVLHVGSIEKPNDTGYNGNHLCFKGVVEILTKIDPKPQLVILTEWGYEFGRIGINGRTTFTSFVAKELNAKGYNEYYAAVKGNNLTKDKENGIPIIPADINLRIHLPDMFIYVENETSPVGYRKVVAEESLESIYYNKV